MKNNSSDILVSQQQSEYYAQGFTHSIPILDQSEVNHFRSKIEKVNRALGGNISRLNGLHFFFKWAWDLAITPKILYTLDAFIGPNIVLKDTRFFYKHGHTPAYVGWHQDGFRQQRSCAAEPTIWLGLTEASVENGCLRVIPRSHKLGLVEHDLLPSQDNLTAGGTTARANVDSPHDVVMPAGHMSLHHPLTVHGSNPNLSPHPRIGFSATYVNAQDAKPHPNNLLVRGKSKHQRFERKAPMDANFEAAMQAYLASDFAKIACSTH